MSEEVKLLNNTEKQSLLIQDVAKISKRLLINDMYYGMFLSTIEKEYSSEVPLAAVAVHRGVMEFKLLINYDEWIKYSDEVKYGVLKHEAMHLTNFHLLTADLYPNSKMDNVATDCEINQYIPKQYLPSWGIFLEDLRNKHPKLDWKDKAGRAHYYNELNKLSEEEKKQMGIDEKAEHKWIVVDADGNISNEDLTEAEKEVIRVSTEGTMEKLAEEMKAQGNVPFEIDQLIKGFVKPKPKYDYKKYIRNFVGNSTKYMIKTSRIKENQRFPGQPTVKLKSLNRILVLVDESGLKK